MKKWLMGLMVVLVAFGMSACSEKSASSEDTIKIGAVIDSSGGSAPLGKGEEETLKMLVEQVNEEGGIGGKKIKLISIDSKSDQNEAVLATKKLIDQEKVQAIIGGTISGNSLAMIPLIEKAGVPYISLAASKQVNNPDDGSSRKWTFKTAQGDDIVIPKLLEYLKSQDLTNVAWLGVANSYGTSGHEEFEKLAPEYGIQAIVEEEFEATVNDAKAMLTKVKKENPQAIIVWGTAKESAVITKNIRELGMEMPIIESHGIGSKDFIELAGDAANGVIFPAGKLLVVDELAENDKQKSTLLKYKAAFEKTYNKEPSTFGGHTWDAFHILKIALEKSKGDKAKIRDELEKTQSFIGISGEFNMTSDDHNGLGPDSLIMVKIDDDGKWSIGE
ncbi:MAG: ABC transporter substrate-binding protein [Heyndrickxia oleronia]|jgi:branched-chain amino acid transport system substrate-binding protein|uniref:ABC transporter substrate-binding protein n=1 Tax=Heyndrickxia oleronia TaxID=38875 RepID=UPI00242EDCEF|nr:ABC transporter substrate-binding protein [Heyndrickxia oleronia]MCI1593512.1 ABC transporter substrate-binding protein [Heyndrickxia oleronia]MCI1615933.1 ABC transporter substrate-binding protein [Heyndrickxia oleronia]MCI1746525.1 ABC transporter substrate-binding protein [Heyndrickxia oleronia]